MDNNLVLNSIEFRKSYDDSSSSIRQSSARGVNTPDRLTIRETKSKNDLGQQCVRRLVHVGRVDKNTATGTLGRVEMYAILSIPVDAESAAVNATLATFRSVIAEAGLLEAVLNSER